jgi:ComF family protein
MLDFILNWLFPPVCLSCRHIIPVNNIRRVRLRLCENCEPLLEPLKKPVCKKCGAPQRNTNNKKDLPLCSDCKGKSFYFSRNTAVFAYDELLRDIIHEIKFRNRKYAAIGLGNLWAAMADENDFEGIDIIVPVPLHQKKERERGFNQAAELARPLSERFNIPLIEGELIRNRDTNAQSGLSPRGRIENVSGAFTLRSVHDFKHKKILLIDDIYTTGASINECARVLKQNGASEIRVMTLTVTLRKPKQLKNFSEQDDT